MSRYFMSTISELLGADDGGADSDPRHVASCLFLSYHVMSCHVDISCHVIFSIAELFGADDGGADSDPRYVMSLHVMLCHFKL